MANRQAQIDVALFTQCARFAPGSLSSGQVVLGGFSIRADSASVLVAEFVTWAGRKRDSRSGRSTPVSVGTSGKESPFACGRVYIEPVA